MGRAIALALASEGADLVLAARSRNKLDAVSAEIEEIGQRCVTVQTDVTDADQCARLAQAAGEFGRGQVDVLVNNAFIEDDWRGYDGFEVERMRGPFEVNLIGSMTLTRLTLPLLREAGGGAIVMITTTAPKVANPVMIGYGCSKAALTTASQALAREVRPDGIRVNCVAPGPIDGDSLETYYGFLAEQEGAEKSTVRKRQEALSALGVIPTPEQIAGSVAFLASDLSRQITGQTLHVNGGRYME